MPVSRCTSCTFFTANGHMANTHTYTCMYVHSFVSVLTTLTYVTVFWLPPHRVSTGFSFSGQCLPALPACLSVCLSVSVSVLILTEWRAKQNVMKWNQRNGSGRVIHVHFIIMGSAYAKCVINFIKFTRLKRWGMHWNWNKARGKVHVFVGVFACVSVCGVRGVRVCVCARVWVFGSHA